MINQTTTDSIEIIGEINRVVYQSPEDGFCILKIEDNSGKTSTVVGHCAQPQTGQTINARGIWIENNQYGKQFKAESINPVLPKSKKAIQQYLSSGMIKGIGKSTAKQLVDFFGVDILEILSKQPESLLKIPGSGKKKLKSICNGWKAQQGASEVMVFLQEHQVGPARAVRIYKKYGTEAINIIQNNPYKLYEDIPGIGFLLADKIARSIGMPNDHSERINHGLIFTLHEHASQGHTTISIDDLIVTTKDLLNVSEALVVQGITAMIEQEKIIAIESDGKKMCCVASLYQCEQLIARKLFTLCQHPSHMPSKERLKTHFENINETLGYELSNGQMKALETILSNKISILTGGPGVGKTTLVQSVVHILQKSHVILLLCAPTGRAAKRLKESTGHNAKTVHRALGVDPVTKQFQMNEKNPLAIEYCIIDEASMLDVHLTKHIISALPKHCGLLLVGDVDQLPSVGPGNVLNDMIKVNRIPVIELTEIFRQAQTSLIVRHAHRVRDGSTPIFENSTPDKIMDCYGIFDQDTDKMMETIQRLVCDRIPKRFGFDPMKEIQILCPMQKGHFGAQALNRKLQECLNQEVDGVKYYNQVFKIGDRVMQTRNNYDKDVFNGDIGYIAGHQEEKQVVQVHYDDKTVDYYYDELDEITLAYAMTIHKSQGSEFKAVIMPIVSEQYIMLQRNLIYTAMTRAKSLLVIIGDKKSLRLGIQKDSVKARLTRLQDEINNCFLAALKEDKDLAN